MAEFFRPKGKRVGVGSDNDKFSTSLAISGRRVLGESDFAELFLPGCLRARGVDQIARKTPRSIGDADPRAEYEGGSGVDRQEAEFEGGHRILLLIFGERPHGGRQLSVFYRRVLRGVSRGEWL